MMFAILQIVLALIFICCRLKFVAQPHIVNSYFSCTVLSIHDSYKCFKKGNCVTLCANTLFSKPFARKLEQLPCGNHTNCGSCKNH